VDLDAPVRRCIPWFRVADPEASALITVRHLLSQTSGLTEGAGRGATLAAGMHPLEPAVRALAAAGLARSPGAAFEYSNLNYTTLGLVVEMAAGEPFEAYLNRHIFEPLSMHRTCTAGRGRGDRGPWQPHAGRRGEVPQPACRRRIGRQQADRCPQHQGRARFR
jgi:CubicO group peptidase (beta-lactamase class C family)